MSALATATIRGRREALGLTQATAADLARVSQQVWQRWETGGKVAPFQAARCMALLNGEVEIPADTPRKLTPAECSARAKTPHRWTRDEAREAGKRGGKAVSRVPGHMAKLGHKGGMAGRRQA